MFNGMPSKRMRNALKNPHFWNGRNISIKKEYGHSIPLATSYLQSVSMDF